MVSRLTLIQHCMLFAIILVSAVSADAQFDIGGDSRVNPEDFEITVFASGLNYPVGMALLPDSSLLVAVSNGSSFFGSSSGRLVRLVDNDEDGIADEQLVLVDDVPGGGLTALRAIDDLVFTTGQGSGKPIMIYRLGANLNDELIEAGRLEINYNRSWLHPHSALAVRYTPGFANSYDLFFQLGSEQNFAASPHSLQLTSTIGIEGSLMGEAIYMLRMTDNDTSISGSVLQRIATGLRNPAGMAFHPIAGDLYFQDNGIDGLTDPNEPLSADELNVIPAGQIGAAILGFGFPENYIAYRSGEFVGGEGIPPLVAFQPIPDPQNGDESEGANDVVFAPPNFPTGLNNGIFVGFHGRFSLGGINNEENPLVYVDLDSQDYFHFIGNAESAVGHLDGLLATNNSLYVADISPGGGLGSSNANTGVIYRIRARQNPVSVEDESRNTPNGFRLSNAYPNPFNPSTAISFSIPNSAGASRAGLAIYNIAGQEIRTLFDELAPPGFYRAEWDGKDSSGKTVASGTYIYRLTVGDRFSQSKRVSMIR